MRDQGFQTIFQKDIFQTSEMLALFATGFNVLFQLLSTYQNELGIELILAYVKSQAEASLTGRNELGWLAGCS